MTSPHDFRLSPPFDTIYQIIFDILDLLSPIWSVNYFSTLLYVVYILLDGGSKWVFSSQPANSLPPDGIPAASIAQSSQICSNLSVLRARRSQMTTFLIAPRQHDDLDKLDRIL
jgi:hypothetical protein